MHRVKATVFTHYTPELTVYTLYYLLMVMSRKQRTKPNNGEFEIPNLSRSPFTGHQHLLKSGQHRSKALKDALNRI